MVLKIEIGKLSVVSELDESAGIGLKTKIFRKYLFLLKKNC
jgi:hypothetical protein